LEDRTNVGESSCNFRDGTDQRVQSLMFMKMMNFSTIRAYIILLLQILFLLWMIPSHRTNFSPVRLLLMYWSRFNNPASYWS